MGLLKKLSYFSAVCMSSLVISASSDGGTPPKKISAYHAPSEASSVIDVSTKWRNTENETKIILSDDGISCKSEFVTIDGKDIFITGGGDYYIRGSLTDGRITIDAGGAAVRLILDDVTINSAKAPIFVKSAALLTVSLEKESGNSLVCSGCDTEDFEFSGAVLSESDILINGSGSLNVVSELSDGIVSLGDMLIAGGSLDISADGDGIVCLGQINMLSGELNLATYATSWL